MDGLQLVGFAVYGRVSGNIKYLIMTDDEHDPDVADASEYYDVKPVYVKTTTK